MSHKIGSGLCVFRKGCVMNLNRIHGWGGFLFSSLGKKASSQFLSLKGTHCAVQLDCESERGWVSVQEGVRDVGESEWLTVCGEFKCGNGGWARSITQSLFKTGAQKTVSTWCLQKVRDTVASLVWNCCDSYFLSVPCLVIVPYQPFERSPFLFPASVHQRLPDHSFCPSGIWRSSLEGECMLSRSVVSDSLWSQL